MTRTRIKICGCSGVDEAMMAVDAGADAVGVILAEDSPRRVSIERFHEIAQYVPALVELVAVFVDPPSSMVDEALKAGATPQFHGDEPADACERFAAGHYLKAFHIDDEALPTGEAFAAHAKPFAHATWLFDTADAAGRSGGSGRTFAWESVRRIAGERRVVVAGGLTPENVGTCVRTARPYAVDVRSGVETAGRKDVRKMHAFVRAVRDADAEVNA